LTEVSVCPASIAGEPLLRWKSLLALTKSCAGVATFEWVS
jgi:hypothetical protein